MTNPCMFVCTCLKGNMTYSIIGLFESGIHYYAYDHIIVEIELTFIFPFEEFFVFTLKNVMRRWIDMYTEYFTSRREKKPIQNNESNLFIFTP